MRVLIIAALLAVAAADDAKKVGGGKPTADAKPAGGAVNTRLGPGAAAGAGNKLAECSRFELTNARI